MEINLTTAQLAVLGVLATLISACVASLTALLVSAVNAWAARRVAREKDLRDYRKSALEHLLKISDNCTMFFKLVVAHVTNKDVKSLEATMDAIQAEKNITNNIAFIAIVRSDRMLNEAAGRFSIQYNNCLAEAVRLHRLVSTGEPLDAGRLDRMADSIFHDAVRLRLAAEDFIYGSRKSRKELKRHFDEHPQPQLDASPLAP